VTKILVIPGQGESFSHTLEGDSLIVGRSSVADLRVEDRFLSRKHARLFVQDDDWWVEDLGSRNGTKLNGTLVGEPTRLAEGDEIRLCQSSIIYGADEVPLKPLKPEPASASVTESDPSEPHTRFLSASELSRLQSSDSVAGLDSVDALRRQAERLHLLNDLHRALGQSMELDELLEMILDRSFSALKTEAAIIYLRSPDGEYYRAAHRSDSKVDAEHLYSETLLREVADKGMAALVTEVAKDRRFDEAVSILDMGVHSLAAAPLLDSEGSLGMIALTSTLRTALFDEEDLELLVSLASIAAMRIRNVALTEKAAEEAAKRARFEEELTLARQIQVALLPSQLPEVEGYELYGGNIPSRGVSGDFYSVIERTNGEFVFMVVDVSGKGMAASLLTFSLEALAAGPIEMGESPAEICTKVCRWLYGRTLPAKYATMILAVLDPETHTLSYANAGHNPGLLVTAGGKIQELGPSGPPVGLLPEGAYTDSEVQLEPGDLMLLYTDGITEASDPDDEEFGMERLARVSKKRRQDDLELLAEAIQHDLDAFAKGIPYADDRTLVMLRRT